MSFSIFDNIKTERNIMSIWNSEQKIGIELEILSTTGVDGMKKYLDDNKISGFTYGRDGSLGFNGVEVRFDKGVPLNELKGRIEELYKIANDTDGSLGTGFGTLHDNPHLPESVKASKGNILRYNNWGTTGLHIHFEIPTDYHLFDILRLQHKLSLDKKKIDSLAWRTSRQWSPHTTGKCATLTKNIKSNTRLLHLSRQKYSGMNIANLGSKKMNTIEFRYGDALLMTDPVAFEAYITYLKTTMDNCFTGENVFKVGRSAFLSIDEPVEVYDYENWFRKSVNVNVHSYERGAVMGEFKRKVKFTF